MSTRTEPIAVEPSPPQLETGALPPFLAACRSLPASHTPIWLMRQAGRYLPEYRALRARHDFLTLVRTPELAAEVTLQPLRRFPLDAAILFSDILTPVDGLDLGLDFAPGPVLARPLRTVEAIAAFRTDGVEERARHVAEAIALVRRELPATTPLIGFAGAPFTLFAYLVEGRSGGAGHGFEIALDLLEREPDAAGRLLDELTDLTIAYLSMQARAGAQALMLFDTRAGLLEPARFAAIALPRVRRILEAIARFELPRIYFPRSRSGEEGYVAAAATLPVEVVGADERAALGKARQLLGPRIAAQGNLAPAALGAEEAELDRSVDRVLAEAGSAPGFIFSLGDGVPQTTDPAKVARLVERVHEKGRREVSR